MHNENCKANHFGNSGSMEVSGAIEIFQRSESLHGLRYTKCLGDGETGAYKAVNEMQPYGDTGIEKLECVGYVKKQMGTRLRALKLKMKRKKLSDEKTLDDHGRLADAEIDKLQRYFGLAIRNNTDSINSMKRAIWATYFHKAFIDAYRQHGLCRTNEDTWRYIKNFAKRALPLTNLLRKDTPFEWTSETQEAFDDIKKAILNPPVLALPDPNAELQITTDASSRGIGAVLEQKYPDSEVKPLYFFQRN
ncbi:uncharacterized protein TNCV_1995351 [Trichonephila clavipes]|nr:uncharacterized protein TNCV_1995351 [Trichonephila clavipes]